jgi:uncharacterized protein DUF928
MKLTHGIGLVLVCAAAALAIITWGGFNTPSPPLPATEQTAFIPPAMGVPADRVGAGTRGVSADPVGVHLIAPKGGGLTTLATPILIWKLERPFDGDVRVSLSTASGTPVYSTMQNGPFQPGYLGLDLNGSGSSLNPNTIYRWSVRLTKKGTGQVVAEREHLIERVDPPSNMISAAQSGLWYDAVHPLVAVDSAGRVDLVDVARLQALLVSAGLAD